MCVYFLYRKKTGDAPDSSVNLETGENGVVVGGFY